MPAAFGNCRVEKAEVVPYLRTSREDDAWTPSLKKADVGGRRAHTRRKGNGTSIRRRQASATPSGAVRRAGSDWSQAKWFVTARWTCRTPARSKPVWKDRNGDRPGGGFGRALCPAPGRFGTRWRIAPKCPPRFFRAHQAAPPWVTLRLDRTRVPRFPVTFSRLRSEQPRRA